MTEYMCDLCNTRPATVRVAIVQDGRRRQLDVCDYHYRQLSRHQRQLSPLESLFRGGTFGDFLNVTGSPLGTSRSSDADHVSAQHNGVDFDRHFSDQSKEYLQRAAARAAQRGKREIDTEDLLYALTESDLVETILSAFRLSGEALRATIESRAKSVHPQHASNDERFAVSPRLKSALDRAFLISRQMGQAYVGPEHMLIGLAEVTDGLASAVLAKAGIGPQALRDQTMQILDTRADETESSVASETPQLDKYSRDITRLAREGKLDPVIGRSKEIENVVEVLARRKKNNPVLIGEPGVGKTAIVEGLAQRMINGDVPETLRNKRLVELSINSLVAGAKYRGEFEERVKALMEEISAHRDALVLFVDEVHTIVGAGQGGGEGGLDIANVFKPAMARGELNLIGATTLSEYQKHIEKDAALERRFQPVLVSEPTVEQTVSILRGLRDRLEAHHRVTIQDEAFVAAAELSDRYITGRFLPDKAVDLIDQASARVHLSTTSRPAELLELEASIAQLKRERAYASSRRQFDRASQFEEQVSAKATELDEATETWKAQVASSSAEVSAEHVAQIVANLTGIPVADLTAQERERLLRMEERLHQRVIGQHEAIGAVSDAVRRSRAGLQQAHRPIAVFLFLGPTGVGKTELAKALAEVVFGDEDAIVRIDMSEYMERHAVARLIGAPPGYVGYEEGGQLTERVRRRPYSVILLDEIEKAHPDVYNVLLQVFDDGRLTDGKGRVVDFGHALIIATSNLASDVIMGQKRGKIGFTPAKPGDGELVRADIMSVLRNHFRPEFLNRIDDIIVFQSLSKEEITAIVGLQLTRVARTASSQDIELVFDQSMIDHLADKGFRPEFGARELGRIIRQLVENKLARELLAGTIKEGSRVRFRYDASVGEAVFELAEQPTVEPSTPSAEGSSAPAAKKPRSTPRAGRTPPPPQISS